MRHHETTLERFLVGVRADPASRAVVLIGSVARGQERPNSDVDVYLVVTDKAFEAARGEGRMSYTDDASATYDGGYVDVKLASPATLRAAADRADDPTRASFLGARIVWSQFPELGEAVAAIPAVSEAEWERRAGAFAAQYRLYAGYFLPQAEALADPYLRRWAAVHLVNAASRALLAHHRVLFAGPKYLRSSVAALPDLPDRFDELTERLLDTGNPQDGMALLTAMESFRDWGVPSEQTLSRYALDNELAWLTGERLPEGY